jgi:hypothetical protein
VRDFEAGTEGSHWVLMSGFVVVGGRKSDGRLAQARIVSTAAHQNL